MEILFVVILSVVEEQQKIGMNSRADASEEH